MRTEEKLLIKQTLAAYCEQKGSQKKAANSLRGVSAATVSQVLNDNWELITDDMWRNIATQIGYDPNRWVIVETRGYRRMTQLLSDAQAHSLVIRVKQLKHTPEAMLMCIILAAQSTGTVSTL